MKISHQTTIAKFQPTSFFPVMGNLCSLFIILGLENYMYQLIGLTDRTSAVFSFGGLWVETITRLNWYSPSQKQYCVLRGNLNLYLQQHQHVKLSIMQARPNGFNFQLFKLGILTCMSVGAGKAKKDEACMFVCFT